ncbi:MAG TPA: patatin-like phospholipase family protein [Pyrinomonadaceae bacterium]|nr:patatin-like phospholipase family protein [Pyrinomonadaceae bacterium]HMP64439.1 patatin-like phospholipase family protein [Pyrinomonadaceae bacterium]
MTDGKKTGLALSGGGARGFAHIGVLRALEEAGIEIGAIAGTSAGALVGGAYAAGLDAGRILEMGRGVSWFGISSFSYSPRGLLSNAALGRYIEEYFPVKRFEELRIPFAAVACDLKTEEEVVFKKKGDLATAIRASCAIPGVFVPVDDGTGRDLVDGGVTSPMPTRAVKKLGAETIIAVDLLTCGSNFASSPSTLIGTFVQSAMMAIRTASKNQHYRAAVVIEPQIAHIRPDEIKRMDELVELGYKAAMEKMDEILQATGK